MAKLCLCVLVLLLLAPALKAKEETPIPAIITNATYVLVTTYSGDVFSPNVSPEDRQAVGDVQEAVQKWGRYKLVYKREHADLILVVRKGRLAEVRAGVRVGAGSDANSRGTAHAVGAEAGDPQDTLTVFIASQGIDSAPLWRGRNTDGLNPPKMQLVKDLRSQVEATAKKP